MDKGPVGREGKRHPDSAVRRRLSRGRALITENRKKKREGKTFLPTERRGRRGTHPKKKKTRRTTTRVSGRRKKKKKLTRRKGIPARKEKEKGRYYSPGNQRGRKKVLRSTFSTRRKRLTSLQEEKERLSLFYPVPVTCFREGRGEWGLTLEEKRRR